jgi:hypothetical protein
MNFISKPTLIPTVPSVYISDATGQTDYVALDEFVRTTMDQSISGIKTFGSQIVVPSKTMAIRP